MRAMTMQEIKDLQVGDWVWITNESGEDGTYAQLYVAGRAMLQFATAVFVLPPHIISDYGKTWFAYKNKEQAEGVSDKLEAECDDKERYIIELYNRARETERKLKEIEGCIAKGEIVKLPKDIELKLLSCIVFKNKYGKDYFKPFKGADAFGQPQVMSMDELLLRTTIELLGIADKSEAERRLAKLTKENEK